MHSLRGAPKAVRPVAGPSQEELREGTLVLALLRVAGPFQVVHQVAEVGYVSFGFAFAHRRSAPAASED